MGEKLIFYNKCITKSFAVFLIFVQLIVCLVFETNAYGAERNILDDFEIIYEDLINEIEVKGFTEVSKKNIENNEKIMKTSNLPPKSVKVKINFKDKYIPLDVLDKEMDDLIFYTITYESNEFMVDDNVIESVFGRDGDNLYRLVNLNYQETNPLDQKKELISDKCKKVLGGRSDFFYLTYDNEVYFYGVAPQKKENGRYTKENVFGANDDYIYENELVLRNVDDIWLSQDAVYYKSNNVLYKINNDSASTVVLNNCGSIKSVCGMNGATFIVMEDGTLYGIGKNLKKLIDNNRSKKYVFKDPQKILLPINAKEAYLSENKKLYVLDKNDVLYWIRTDGVVRVHDNVKKVIEEGDVVILDNSQNVYSILDDTFFDANGKEFRQVIKQHIYKNINNYYSEFFLVKDHKTFFHYPYGSGNYVINMPNEREICNYWWIKYYISDDGFYSSEPYLVENNVKNTVGKLYNKKNNWYLFGRNQNKKKMISKPVKKMVIMKDNYYFIQGNIIYSIDLSDSKPSKKREVFAKGVSNVWTYGANIAYIKNGSLYSYGEIEDLRWVYDDEEGFPAGYDPRPPYRVKYTGIKGKNVANVRFDDSHIYIIMKSGKVYKILPKQKWGKLWYRKKCKVKKKYLMNIKNVADLYIASGYKKNQTDDSYDFGYKETIVLTRNNVLKFWRGKHKKDKVTKIQNVKKIDVQLSSYDNSCMFLTMDGDLFGWGYQTYDLFGVKNKSYVCFENRGKIAEGVKDFSNLSYGFMFLTKDNSLYFKGYLWNA